MESRYSLPTSVRSHCSHSLEEFARSCGLGCGRVVVAVLLLRPASGLLGKAWLIPDPVAVGRLDGLDVDRQFVVLDAPVNELPEHAVIERIDAVLIRCPIDECG